MGIGTLRRYYKEWGYGSPVTVPESVAAPEPATLEPTPEEVAAAELHKRAVELVVAAGHSVEAAEKLISEIGAAKVLEVTELPPHTSEVVTVKTEDVGTLSEILEAKE